jgi:uncharacterized protein YbcC (UPF0753/DUF2309 family)
MQLRGITLLASEIISQYWPMRTFVHHNPLHSMEDFDFEEAVKRGERLLGGRGYLTNLLFRNYVKSGRICIEQIDRALETIAKEKELTLGTRTITQIEVLRILLLNGITAPVDEVLEPQISRRSDRQIIRSLAERLATHLSFPREAEKSRPSEREERRAFRVNATLSTCCDDSFGSQITELINRESIKWCEAYLDEGHATWTLPERERGFYGTWKSLAEQELSPCGISESRKKISALPSSPEDALLEHLLTLGIPFEHWQDYLTLHLAALPGWTGFIKWRADQNDYEWQQVFPVDLVQYLAVRLWYERELVQKVCPKARTAGGYFENLTAKKAETQVSRENVHLKASWRLIEMTKHLGIEPEILLKSPLEGLAVLVDWLDGFPESEHGIAWLRAFEAGYREKLVSKLRSNFVRERERGDEDSNDLQKIRPQAAAIFCIDVRSESFRRHLEAVGDYDTLGFAGFFNVFIRFRALGSRHDTYQFPVIMKAKNAVREVPRTFQGQMLTRHQAGAKWLHAGHELLHDLKENMVTPYVTVESLGWFYSLPMIGKTLFVDGYRKLTARLQRFFVPPMATSLTVEKLSRDEVNEMLASEQRATIRRALNERFGDRDLNLSLERLEGLRLRALDDPRSGEHASRNPSHTYALTPEEELQFVETLNTEFRINPGWAFARMERITQTGFTLSEQIFTVETALRMMGLTRNFARLVLLCGHNSTSENNPFEAALDCGACGGNGGKPNARVLAAMANKAQVREQLGKNGIVIPQDTFFIAGQHDTATDEVELFDLEDLPPTHLNDLLRLIRDLKEAGSRNSRERCARFPELRAPLSLAAAGKEVRRRSGDWSQVRPEWGLSGNAAFIIGRRALTRGLDLEGRVFLHSYDCRQDPTGRSLEILMTAPQVVGQWINMEHYFSTVDNEVYGSGNKIYHNVVGRFGIMSGPQSDLRTGLATQSVMNGTDPYHEPMRLLTLIEAPRENISRIIQRHRLLKNYYDNGWVQLIALEPEEKSFHSYIPKEGWVPLKNVEPIS